MGKYFGKVDVEEVQSFPVEEDVRMFQHSLMIMPRLSSHGVGCI
jgi:hypothetical protein